MITTFDAEKNVKENARIKNAPLYDEIKDLDLIATEFKYHYVPGHRDFTRNIDNVKESVYQYKKEDFVKVKTFIMKNIIKGHQVVSLKALHKMYNLVDGDRRYRFKLKERTEKQFAIDILFLALSLPNSSCLVISREALEEKPLTQCFTEDTAVRCVAETMKNALPEPFRN